MQIDQAKLKLLAKTIRILSAEAVQKANSGHPGMPMGAADYAAVLWAYFLNINPKDTNWQNRDRFVLSAGHGCVLLYNLLHLFGYDLPISEIKSFRQWGSKTPGHPEYGFTVGVETTTGPLGAGFSNGVGLAADARMMAARYSEQLFNHKVYAIVSDGDLMEGVASEAASLAGHLGLGNMIYLYDDNEISIGGNTNVTFTESVPARFKAYNWNVLDVDGHDLVAINQALEEANKQTDKPNLISCHTTIAFGSPNKAGSAGAHGEPLGADEIKALKKNLGWEYAEDFYVPKEVGEFCCARMADKVEVYNKWQADFKAWQSSNSELAKTYQKQVSKELPIELKTNLIETFTKDAKPEATRNLSGQAIQVIAKHLPGFVGGSADLEPSNKTLIKDSTDIQPKNFKGRNFRFGVREHGMGGLINGLAYTNNWFPYGATFLVFSDYMRPTVRLAAISHLQTLFIFTHDSFWVGEDGPTHQPIEHIMSLRLIPNNFVFRPADGLEVAMCYMAALQNKKAPAVLLFTRQNVDPIQQRADFSPDDILKGAYVVSKDDGASVCIVATGSEVGLAIGAAKKLAQDGVKCQVVSMPCCELFNKQDQSYKDKLIPKSMKRVSIEAGVTTGWDSIVGSDALKIGLDHYGASAPGKIVAEKFGFTVDAVYTKIKAFAN